MQLALDGRMTEYHRWMLRVLYEQLVFLEAQIAKLEAKIQDQLSDYQEAIALCSTIPGIEEVAAANLVAEIGVNMAQFPSAQHLVLCNRNS